jgi:hypothetical protein
MERDVQLVNFVMNRATARRFLVASNAMTEPFARSLLAVAWSSVSSKRGRTGPRGINPAAPALQTI